MWARLWNGWFFLSYLLDIVILFLAVTLEYIIRKYESFVLDNVSQVFDSCSFDNFSQILVQLILLVFSSNACKLFLGFCRRILHWNSLLSELRLGSGKTSLVSKYLDPLVQNRLKIWISALSHKITICNIYLTPVSTTEWSFCGVHPKLRT